MNVEQAFKTAFSITAWFECGERPFTNPSGNFDGQGLSWGPRQNCIGQGSLQPILKRIAKELPVGLLSAALGSLQQDFVTLATLLPPAAQLDFVIKKMNDSSGKRLLPQWSTVFSNLGGIPAVQAIFMDDARASLPAVQELAAWIRGADLVTLRAFCVSYDIVTQNGGVSKTLRGILTLIRPIVKPFKKADNDWLAFVVWARAMWTYFFGQRRFSEDVLDRKLAIVDGADKIHGEFVDLGVKFGLSDEVLA
jgi:hypothetical protein